MATPCTSTVESASTLMPLADLVKQPGQSMPSLLADMYANPRFSDIQIKCGPRTWKLHKEILCAHSAYFRGMFLKGFAEANLREVELKDDYCHILEALFSLMYGTTPRKEIVVAQISEASFWAKMFITASKYQVDSVAKTAKLRFKVALCLPMTFSKPAVLSVAEQLGDRSGVDELWDIIIEKCRQRLAAWVQKDPKYLDEMDKIPGLCRRLLGDSIKRTGKF